MRELANPIAGTTSYFASSREFQIQDSLGVGSGLELWC